MPKQSESIFYSVADIGVGKFSGGRPGVAEKIGDYAVEPVRFAEDYIHNARRHRFAWSDGFKHLNCPAHRSQRISYLVCKAGCGTPDGGETGLSSDAFFH